MTNNPDLYAKNLLKTQGKEQAKRMAEDNLNICKKGSNTFLFDEAEFHLSTERTLAAFELNKVQTKKVEKVKESREKRNLNFWQQVFNIVNKG